MRKVLSSLFLLFFAAFVSSLGQTTINPATQIRWPAVTGTVNPVSPTWPCTLANYGQPYTNTTSGALFACASSGWVAVGSAGTVTVTGSPASGNLTKFSGGTSITNADLTGDCTTSGAVTTTCAKVNGVAYPASPSTGTLPVVTGSNVVTYETLATLGGVTTSGSPNTPDCAYFTAATVVTGTPNCTLDSSGNLNAMGQLGVGLARASTSHVLDSSGSSSSTTLNGANPVELRIANTDTTANNYEGVVGAMTNSTLAVVTAGKMTWVNASHAAGSESADLHILNRNAGAVTDWWTATHDGILKNSSNNWNITAAGSATFTAVNNAINAGSDLSAAVTACGSNPTTIWITQALTPNTLSVPANCALQFVSGGAINPLTGQTITINGSIVSTAPGQQIFGGLGTVVFGKFTTVQAGWYGVSTSNSTNAVNMQLAVNAVATNGGNVHVPCAASHYLMGTSTVAVTTSFTSIVGDSPYCTYFEQSSPTNSIVTFIGANSGAKLVGSNISGIFLLSSVRPPNTSTKDCLYESDVSYYSVEHVYGTDCINVFHWHGAGVSNFTNDLFGEWVQAGYDSSYTQLVGNFVDSLDGDFEDSLYLNRDGIFASTPDSGAIYYGTLIKGTRILDVESVDNGDTNVTYGIAIVPTGGTGSQQGDIKITHYSVDGCRTAGLYVTGLVANASGINLGGQSALNCSNGNSVDIESSAGVVLSNFTATEPIKVNNSNNIVVSNSTSLSASYLNIINTTASTFSNNVMLGGASGAAIAQHILLTTSTGNNLTNPTLGGSVANNNGYAVKGINADATSVANNVTSPSCNATSVTVTTCYSGITPFSMYAQGSGLVRFDQNAITSWQVDNENAGGSAQSNFIAKAGGNTLTMGANNPAGANQNYVNASIGSTLQLLYHGTDFLELGATRIVPHVNFDNSTFDNGWTASAGATVSGGLFHVTSTTSAQFDKSIGIGTAAPFVDAGYLALDIRGATNGGEIFLGTGSGSSGRYAYFTATSASANFGSIGAIPVLFKPNDAIRAGVDSSGNFGVGSNSTITSDAYTVSSAGAEKVASIALNGGTAVTANQGTGASLQHSTGAITTNDCVKYDSTGNTVDSGTACGTGTISSGSTNFLPKYTAGTTLGNSLLSDSASSLAYNSINFLTTTGVGSFAASTTIASKQVCLADGTNCLLNPHQLYSDIQGVLFSTSTMLGPVFYEPVAGTMQIMMARLSGAISCAVAPVVQLLDLGTSPTTVYGSATAISNLTTGTSDAAYTTGTALGVAITAGHYYGFAFSAGTCVTAPAFDLTAQIQ